MSGMEKIAGLVIGAVVLLLIIGYLFVDLWPVITTVSGNVTAMTGTDAGTKIFQAMWPTVTLVVAVIIVVSIIFWSLRQLNREG